MMRLLSLSLRTKSISPRRLSTHAGIHKNLKRALSVSPDTFVPNIESINTVSDAIVSLSSLTIRADKSDDLNSPHSPRPERTIYNYQENHTAALSLPVKIEQLEFEIHDPKAMLSEAKENIIEHARRRVELFFYTLAAYYKTGFTPERGHTILQYGRGRNSEKGENITQACHSSFFGAFVDASPALISPNKIKEYQHSILSGTHLLNSLNATVELPGFVNRLDDEFENICRCRAKGLTIIHKVSLGKLNPIEGTGEFFKMMEKAFYDIENHLVNSKHRVAYLLRNTPDSPSVIKPELIELTKHGTFAKKWNIETQSVENEYIEMLLRMTPEQKAQCASNPEKRMECYEDKIVEMQNEILRKDTFILS